LQLHFAAAKALQIWKSRMSADLNTVGFTEPDCVHHDKWVA